jgi:predicted PurR-regulated permease PerM
MLRASRPRMDESVGERGGAPAGGGTNAGGETDFLRRIVVGTIVVATGATILAIGVLGVDILLAGFGGVLFAILLRAAADLIGRYTPVPEEWSFTALLVALLALVAGGGVLLIPFARRAIEAAQEEVPRIVEELRTYLEGREWGQWLLEQGNGMAEGGGDGALGVAGGVFGVAGDWFYYLLTAFFFGMFAAAKPRIYIDGIVHLAPLRMRGRFRHLLSELGKTLRWWLVGQGIAMVLIGVSTGLLLWLLDVPLPAILGLIVGLLGFIPYIGPILGLVPVAIVAGTQGSETLLYVLAAYTGVQVIEGYVVTPLIQHRMVYLPPAFTVLAQILLGSLLGILGFILATPLAAVVMVLTRFYREDLLREPGAVAEASR